MSHLDESPERSGVGVSLVVFALAAVLITLALI